jgi:hypothetical protein
MSSTDAIPEQPQPAAEVALDPDQPDELATLDVQLKEYNGWRISYSKNQPHLEPKEKALVRFSQCVSWMLDWLVICFACCIHVQSDCIAAPPPTGATADTMRAAVCSASDESPCAMGVGRLATDTGPGCNTQAKNHKHIHHENYTL